MPISKKPGCHYSQAGTYALIVKFYIKLDNGTEQLAQTERQMVTLSSPAILNKMLLGVYTELLAKFRANNPTQASNVFHSYARNKYADGFAHIANLPSMADAFGVLVDKNITEEFAEYVILRQKNGKYYGYPVHLTPGEDGIWRIAGM